MTPAGFQQHVFIAPVQFFVTVPVHVSYVQGASPQASGFLHKSVEAMLGGFGGGIRGSDIFFNGALASFAEAQLAAQFAAAASSFEQRNRGASAAAIAALPLVTLTAADVSARKACSICLSDYVEGETSVRRLPCGHLYHDNCIMPWLERNSTCPNCRLSVECAAKAAEDEAAAAAATPAAVSVSTGGVGSSSSSSSGGGVSGDGANIAGAGMAAGGSNFFEGLHSMLRATGWGAAVLDHLRIGVTSPPRSSPPPPPGTEVDAMQVDTAPATPSNPTHEHEYTAAPAQSTASSTAPLTSSATAPAAAKPGLPPVPPEPPSDDATRYVLRVRLPDGSLLTRAFASGDTLGSVAAAVAAAAPAHFPPGVDVRLRSCAIVHRVWGPGEFKETLAAALPLPQRRGLLIAEAVPTGVAADNCTSDVRA